MLFWFCSAFWDWRYRSWYNIFFSVQKLKEHYICHWKQCSGSPFSVRLHRQGWSLVRVGHNYFCLTLTNSQTWHREYTLTKFVNLYPRTLYTPIPEIQEISDRTTLYPFRYPERTWLNFSIYISAYNPFRSCWSPIPSI